MQPSDKFKEVIRLTRICLSFTGADVINPNYKINLRTYIAMVLLVIYFLFSIYTVHLKIPEGWTSVLQVFCTVGSGFQGASKLITVLRYSRTFSSHCIFLTSIYAKFEVKGGEYTESLNKCISLVQFIFKAAACISVALVLCVTVGPVIITSVTGQHTLPIHFNVPMMDENTKFGYIATAVVQDFCVFLGVVGSFATDMFMLVTFAHCPMFVGILKLKIKELNELSSDFENPETMEMLLDVLKWHQTYSKYVEESDDCFFLINFTQITTSAISLVLTLFVLITGDWIGAHLYLCLTFSMLYLYCGVGTLTEVANDDVINEVYNIHWYNMTITQQKIVGFMLMKSQSQKKITVGGVLPLSVSTGLQVTKTIYTFFMMLLNYSP